MAVKTTLQRLESVESTIADAEAVQAYGTGDLSIKKATLKTLYDRQDQLTTQLTREKRGGGRIRSNWSQGV